jgi:GH15 family glucan-1,4-alpha-glucosidase
MNLLQSSIEIIKANQVSSGAYIACPNFKSYRYCWLRDGSFIAYAMDRTGETDSSERFYHWVNRVICNRKDQIETLIAKEKAGEPIAIHEYLPTRYTLEGENADGDWGNFQLDGYGTWLWGLVEHTKTIGQQKIAVDYELSVKLTVDYLTTFWQTPNYDCWEENPESVHPSTLACIAGGLKAINGYWKNPELEKTISDIEVYIRNHFVTGGSGREHLVKFTLNDEIDANLLWITVPFGILSSEDGVMKTTVERIEKELYKNKEGVHRYLKDTYYGGGAWILLTAWLGWYYALTSRRQKALRIKDWIERQADSMGNLAEQIPINLNRMDYLALWLQKWGPIAKPLLWSHAMYLVLSRELSDQPLIKNNLEVIHYAS